VKLGQVVRAMVLSADPETKRLKLGMKQLEPSAANQFAQQAHVGDRVSGRILEVRGNRVTVELGEGVQGECVIDVSGAGAPTTSSGGSLAEQLAAAWKGGVKPTASSAEPYRQGQVRSFTIKAIDEGGKNIELTPA
jgi:small subunit ribosomal protein S1